MRKEAGVHEGVGKRQTAWPHQHVYGRGRACVREGAGMCEGGGGLEGARILRVITTLGGMFIHIPQWFLSLMALIPLSFWLLHLECRHPDIVLLYTLVPSRSTVEITQCKNALG